MRLPYAFHFKGVTRKAPARVVLDKVEYLAVIADFLFSIPTFKESPYSAVVAPRPQILNKQQLWKQILISRLCNCCLTIMCFPSTLSFTPPNPMLSCSVQQRISGANRLLIALQINSVLLKHFKRFLKKVIENLRMITFVQAEDVMALIQIVYHGPFMLCQGLA